MTTTDRMWRVAAAVLACLLVAAGVRAQDPDPDHDAEPASRFLFGPVGLTPGLSVSNVGVDSNVFNDAVDPRSDMTATISPVLELRMRLRAVRLTGSTGVDYVYYRRYASERSTNRHSTAQFEVLGTRFHPYVNGQLLDVKERPDIEIDTRARRREVAFGGGVDVRIAPRTLFAIAASRRRTDYGDAETFDGVNLGEAFDHTTTTSLAGLRFELTPFTTFVTNVQAERDRFTRDPVRDSNTLRVAPGFEFAPGVMLSGKASVGYRRFDSLASDQPDFSGTVADVNLVYTLLGSTKFEGQVHRDLGYSFQLEQPIYLSTAAQVRITQRLAGPFDALVWGGRTRLSYRTPAGADIGAFDREHRIGGGLEIRMGTGRLSLNAELVERRTNTAFAPSYSGRRYFTSYTYGF